MSILSKAVTEKRICSEEGCEERARVAAEETVKAEITPLPSAITTARIIDDLGRVPYPEGIKSPKVELNINAKDGKFRCAIGVHRLQATVLIYCY